MKGIHYNIRHEHDHFNVYVNENFYCSADTFTEACEEVDIYERKLTEESNNEGHK